MDLNEHCQPFYIGPKEKSKKLVEELRNNPPAVIAIDTETVGLKDTTLLGIGVAVGADEGFYFPVVDGQSPWFPKHLLTSKAITKVYHNALFDIKVLRAAGFEVDDVCIEDTTLMAKLCRLPVQLGDLCQYLGRYGVEGSKELMGRYGVKTMDKLTKEVLAQKCCTDSQSTYMVYEKLYSKCDKGYLAVETSLLHLLLKMSETGIKLDKDFVMMLDVVLADELRMLREAAEELGFNPNSPQQVGYMLAAKNVLLPFKKGNRVLTTDERALSSVDHPIAKLVLRYRELSKQLSTYIRPRIGHDRIHTSFHTDAVTGRISSSKPNLQNIPKGRLRKMFVPDGDVFTDIDFSQVELRVLAHLSQDFAMMEILRHSPDTLEGDLHQATADMMGLKMIGGRKPRDIAKNVNFAMVFGATPETLKETAGIQDLNLCRALIARWQKEFVQAGRYIAQTQYEGLKNGYAVTMYGRPMMFPYDESEDKLKRKAINYAIQGSAADIVKRAMLMCYNLPMLLQVHDELLFNGKVKLPMEQLEHIADFWTPLKVKEMSRWE